ncbi:hypothetical protein KC480_05495 [Bacillus velezensis]|uniref:hypothetical protein n=1 Tax=Bacillus velezensis TaxID=492670 RepID=UPI001E49F006|nr:hypothetical protein [Bacillus velezensis]MCD7910979.1 hypothetical protein [Bacillus velezensis]
MQEELKKSIKNEVKKLLGTVSNDPYQRVSSENGPFEGAMLGAALGAGGAGAGIFGARMHYKGIDKRAERHLNAIESREPVLQRKINKVNNQSENPRMSLIQKAKNKIADAGIGQINSLRSAQLDGLSSKNEQMRSTVDSMYRTNPHAAKEADTSRRSHYAQSYADINNHYNDVIQGSRFSKMKQQVEDSMQSRQARLEKNRDVKVSKLNKELDNLTAGRQKWGEEGVKAMKHKHPYSHVKGIGRSVAAIGASALIGGGAGMILGGLSDEVNKNVKQ